MKSRGTTKPLPSKAAVVGRHSETIDVAVIGAGIIGLASALTLLRDRARSLVVLEAEPQVAAHQTGHNSGVIHSGIYYRPGSLKALLCTAGRDAMYRFCREHGVRHASCGKIILATRKSELPRLAELERRGRANGITSLRRLSPAEIREYEPHAGGVAGLYVGETGVVDYGAVARSMANAVGDLGGEVRTGMRVAEIIVGEDGFLLRSSGGEVRCRNLLNCAGLHSDRIAGMCGLDTGIRIIPFRGEYLSLRPEREHLVRHLIYPVPDPELPFLGVHLTRGIDGHVHAGPNAVLAFARHGYRRTMVSVADLGEMVCYPGFWRMARRHWQTGIREAARSITRLATARALQEMIPDLRSNDLVDGGAGVRAQAVALDGSLVDDFRIIEARGMVHVLNAPSPAATACLAIGQTIRDRANAAFRSRTKAS